MDSSTPTSNHENTSEASGSNNKLFLIDGITFFFFFLIGKCKLYKNAKKGALRYTRCIQWPPKSTIKDRENKNTPFLNLTLTNQ